MQTRAEHFGTGGFTLVELMIVVASIGFLAAIAIPNFVRARESSVGAHYIGDLRVARNAFMLHAVEQGQYPADTLPRVVPAGMATYLGSFPWQKNTSLGGAWDWDYGQFGFTAGVSVFQPGAPATQMVQIDQTIDDGDLSTGSFQAHSQGYISVIE